MGSTRKVDTSDFGPPHAEDLRSRFLAIIDGYLKDKGLDQLIPAENRPYEHRSTEERAEMRDFMGTVKGDGTVSKPTTNDGMFFHGQPAHHNPRSINMLSGGTPNDGPAPAASITANTKEPAPLPANDQGVDWGGPIHGSGQSKMATENQLGDPNEDAYRQEMANKLMAEGYDWKSGRGEEDILNDQKKAKQTQALQTLLGQMQKNHKSEAVRV